MPTPVEEASTGEDASDSSHTAPQSLPGTDDASLAAWIHQAAQLLPSQGPIQSFAFLNPLQALEHLPFDEGLLEGSRLFACQPYQAESTFRKYLAEGRISRDDLEFVVAMGETAERRDQTDCGSGLCKTVHGEAGRSEPEQSHRSVPSQLHRDEQQVGGLTTRRKLRMAMLEYPLQSGTPDELRWFIAETDALRRLRKEVTEPVRENFRSATRRWVLQQRLPGESDTSMSGAGAATGARVTAGKGETIQHVITPDLLQLQNRQPLERWAADDWEACGLRLLWRVVRQGVHAAWADVQSSGRPTGPVSLAERLQRATGVNALEVVDQILIRFCASFLDQGLAVWTLPTRDLGFWPSFLGYFGAVSEGQDRQYFCELPGLASELQKLRSAGMSPLQSIRESLQELGVPSAEQAEFLKRTVVQLRGWASMIYQAEVRPDRIPQAVAQGTLVDYVAARLVLLRVSLAEIARQHWHFEGSLLELSRQADRLQPPVDSSSPMPLAVILFQLSQLLGWEPEQLHLRTRTQWIELVSEVHQFGNLARRRTFHKAYERKLHQAALHAIHKHGPDQSLVNRRPKFQAAFCLDAREESFRRHLEEVEPETQTFGVAGFFGIPMYYRGVADAHFAALCPIVIRPKHWVTEEVVYTQQELFQRTVRARRALGEFSRHLQQGSHGVMSGALISAGLGSLASIPLVARILFPRLTAQMKRLAEDLVQAAPVSRLRLERFTEVPGPEGDAVGLNRTEMVELGRRLLQDLGLTRGFSRLVLLVGHCSSCLNNPHKSAYDCGACSGQAGGPNARAMAMILNDPNIRWRLQQTGLEIPNDTWFVGGEHNTGKDVLRFFDLDLLPNTHVSDFETARRVLSVACERNAHERCRRFYSAPLNLSFAAAHRHVLERTEDLAQTRPEFGNATNALCIVGRRERTRGLYLDRRAFLTSYDPTQDDADLTILNRLLSAVVPVCAGINLQYFLASTDPAGWGSGSKLPHNVTSLVGVMDGAASDLRTGLPLQGVELHEPVRLLTIVEARHTDLARLLDRHAVLRQFFQNEWLFLATLDPTSQAMHRYAAGKFLPIETSDRPLPSSPHSEAWYRGRREHLEFAEIVSTVAPPPMSEARSSRLFRPRHVPPLPRPMPVPS